MMSARFIICFLRSLERKIMRKQMGNFLCNLEIATVVLPLFAGNDQYEVMSCEVTENRLYLKVVNHRLEMEVRKDDIVQAGVMISNSEVGLGAVSIQPLVYRLVCTNGMVVNDMGERRHHVGRQAKAVEDSFALYSDETMEAEDKAFLLKLRDTTMAAIDEARFSQVVGRLQESMAVPITGRVQDVVQLTAQSYGINAEEQEGILKYLIEGGDLSLYGLGLRKDRYHIDSHQRPYAGDLRGQQGPDHCVAACGP